MRTYWINVGTVGALLLLASTVQPAIASQADQATQRAVEESLRDDRDLRRIEVSVRGVEAALTGTVPTLWAKTEAIRLALEVDGINLVATELELPTINDDMGIALNVSEAIQRYVHYTMWDYVDGLINRGVVTLTGRVLVDRNKPDEIFERVAKVPGVREIRNEIRQMTPSRTDEQLRLTIANQLFFSDHFERYAGVRDSPFHIIVERSVITLYGWVQSNIERLEMQRICAQVEGVLRVENELQTLE